MANFYLDHDVSLNLSLLLQGDGHDVRTAQDVGLAQASDDVQLLAAAEQGRISLTHNRKDYILLNSAWARWPRSWRVTAPPHAGIPVLEHRPEPELATAIAKVLNAPFAVHFANALYWWRRNSGWQYQLPDNTWVSIPGLET